jgi:hypothetical protein
MPADSRALVVIGRPHAGKTTLRNLLSELPAVRGGSCSDAIYPRAAVILGHSEEYLAARKETFRGLLVALGNALCADDPAYLARTVYHADCGTLTLPGTFVLDGIRRPEELREFRRHLSRVGVQCVVVWIERPDQREHIIDNTSVTCADADMILCAGEDTGGPVDASGLLDAMFSGHSFVTDHYALSNAFAAAA